MLGAVEQQDPQFTIPTIFKWTGPANRVELITDVDNWQSRIPLILSSGYFHTIVELPPGVHFYRFVVDNVIQVASNQPVHTAADGITANVIDTVLTREEVGTESPPGSYSQKVPLTEDYTRAKEPPVLPSHLHRSLLNSAPIDADPATLPVPAHVVLDHMYTASRKDGVMLLGVTRRYRSKFVTTVFYAPVHRTVSNSELITNKTI